MIVSEAAYQRLSAELGRIYGEMVAAQEEAAERGRRIADLEARLAQHESEKEG